MRERALFFETEESFEEGVEFYVRADGRLSVEVAQEKAVDSHNQSFTCWGTLSREQAIRLRDWLLAEFS